MNALQECKCSIVNSYVCGLHSDEQDKPMSKKTESLLDMCREAYSNGVKSTLTQLREVYGEGLEETDLWNEYMTKETI